MVKAGVLYALILSFTLAFSNDTSSQAPEDEDGSGDDEDVSGFGSGAILIQETKPEHTEAILTTVLPLKSTTDQQSAVDEVQSTSRVITSPAKDLEENTLVGLVEIHKSNASEVSEMKTDVTQVNPTEEASVFGITNSTSSNVHSVVHHFRPSVTEGKGAPESTTADSFEGDLHEESLLAEGVHFNSSVAIQGSAVPTKNATFVGKFGSEIEGSGQSEPFYFETAVTKKQLEKDRSSNVGASVENGTTDASKGIMDRKEVLGGVIAGGLVGLLFAVFLVGFMLYRMKKKDEGSYSLEEPKHSNGGYQKPKKQEEFYA